MYGWGATPPTLDSLSDVVKQMDRLGFYSAGFPYHMTLPHAPMFDQFSSHHLFDPTGFTSVPLCSHAAISASGSIH